MSIVVHCPACNVKLTLSEERAGTRLPCPKCDSVINVPRQSPGLSHVPHIPVGQPVKPPPSSIQSNVAAASVNPLTDDNSEQRKKVTGSYSQAISRKKFKSIIALFVLCLLLFCIMGIVLGILRIYEPSEGVYGSIRNYLKLTSTERKLIGSWTTTIAEPNARLEKQTIFKGDGTYSSTANGKLLYKFNIEVKTYGTWSLDDNKLVTKSVGMESSVTPNELPIDHLLANYVGTSHVGEIVSINDKMLILKDSETAKQWVYHRSKQP